MTEITERITSEMSEEEVLGIILDEIMGRAEPDVAEAIRFCAIPHWFNEEIMAWLRGEGLKPSQRSHEILAALTELTFVGPYHERGWAYHENVRHLLLRRWRERDGEEFKELSGRAAGYFEQKAEAASDEERDEWEREQMYHFLASDPEQGFELFSSMFKRARDFYQLSTCALLLQLAEEQETHLSAEDRLWLRFGQGQLAYASAQRSQALTIFEGLLREKLPSSLAGSLANDLGLLYYDKGEWERTIAYYEHALAIWENVVNAIWMATTFDNLGALYRAKGEWERAIWYHGRSLAIVEKVGDEYGMSTTLNNLGLVYKAKGEWERAIAYYERSLAISEKVGDAHGMVTTLNNLGGVYKAKGEWERAIGYHERSLAICEKVGDEHGMAITFNNLGGVYKAKGEWERAIEYCEKDLAICEKVGDEHAMATTFNNLGSVYQAKGEWDQAIAYYERSLAICEKMGDERRMARSYNNIARLYREQGRWEEAIPLFEKSLEMLERIGDKSNARKAKVNLLMARSGCLRALSSWLEKVVRSALNR
jgi:tetratricopeptide (TPR) repeat protein